MRVAIQTSRSPSQGAKPTAVKFLRLTALFLVGIALLKVGGCQCNGSRPDGDRAAVESNAPSQPAESEADASGGASTRPGDSDAEAESGGLTAEENAAIPPGAPGTVSVSHEAGLHVVRWEGTRDDTVVAYLVYRRCPPGDWTEVGRVAVRDERNHGTHEWQDRRGPQCEYAVAAVDRSGRVGPRSDPA